MIDKLELRLPRLTQFRPEPREFMLESRHFANSARTMPSGRHEWVTDLRPVGIDGLLHYSLKRKENDPHEGEHKLELLDTGFKTFGELLGQVSAALEGPTDDLEVMRIDLCADIRGVPVDWFFDRLRVRFKRVCYEMGLLKYQRIGKAGIQTITAGKRPNLVRVYDKVAEYKDQLRKLNRKRSADANELTLEGEFGVAENATITRIERQFGGGRIPMKIDSLGKLRILPEFNPFTNVEIANGSGAGTPPLAECGFDAWVTGTRLRQLQDEMGLQQFNRWLNVSSGGNGARYRKKYFQFLQPDFDTCVTSLTLFEVYRESMEKQLAA
jgi:hypothetical protein